MLADATRAAIFFEKLFSANCTASFIAAATPVASAEPWLFTTVPFSPKKTPPFTLRGSIRFLNLLNEVTAKIDARRDNGV